MAWSDLVSPPTAAQAVRKLLSSSALLLFWSGTRIENLGFRVGDIEAMGIGPEGGDADASPVGKPLPIYGSNCVVRFHTNRSTLRAGKV